MAAVAVFGLLVAYLLGAFEGRGTVKADDVCRQLPDQQAAADIFNSILPQAASYEFVTGPSAKADWHYNSDCFAKGDGENLLILHANAVSTVSWRRWADHELPPIEGKVEDFSSGVKGISADNLAAIYVPCYSREQVSKEPYSLTVYAEAPQGLEGSKEEGRQALIELATTVGRYAHEEAKCDLPAKLPG
ncbi:hypothetical protein ABZ178_26660 [Streptomyces massasporeus]|uniref:hypothetical protein n=1 Tax=Streptomyces massasporeus TaxID=67324 RepID=UPI0033B6C0D1